jgi:hypothetical protein
MTREPISRAISFVFEEWRSKAPAAKRVGRLDSSEMTRALKNLITGRIGIADPTAWFENQMKRVFGIDVFSQPYDLERGFTIIEHKNHPALLIRMEDIQRSLAVGLGELLGIDPGQIEIRTANRASDGWYTDSYRQFKAEFRLAPDLLNDILKSRYARHFYLEDIPSIIKQWSEVPA